MESGRLRNAAPAAEAGSVREDGDDEDVVVIVLLGIVVTDVGVADVGELTAESPSDETELSVEICFGGIDTNHMEHTSWKYVKYCNLSRNLEHR